MGVIPLKRLFEQHYLKEDISQSKAAIYIASFFCVVLALGDYWNLGLDTKFYLTIAFRLLFLTCSLISVSLINRSNNTKQLKNIMLCWCALLIALILGVNFLRLAGNLNFTYIDILITLALYLVLPNSFRQKIMLGTALTIGDMLVVVASKFPTDNITLATILLSYSIANVLGILFSRRMSLFRQKDFMALQKEQDARKELERVAYLDYLTGVYNRRKFFELGEAEFYRYKRYHSKFTLLMLDLDNFKMLNDKYGHDAGDKFLAEFTKVISQSQRSADIIGRLGGEEFAIILPETDLELALQIAGRILLLCESVKVPYQSRFLYTTASIGVSEVNSADNSFKDTMKRADNALYQAKREGRNRMAHQ